MLVSLTLVQHSIIMGYIDPGTGSYLFQVVVAGALGLVVTIKTNWKRIIQFIGKREKSK